jgi:hypothetical protein
MNKDLLTLAKNPRPDPQITGDLAEYYTRRKKERKKERKEGRKEGKKRKREGGRPLFGSRD